MSGIASRGQLVSDALGNWRKRITQSQQHAWRPKRNVFDTFVHGAAPKASPRPQPRSGDPLDLDNDPEQLAMNTNGNAPGLKSGGDKQAVAINILRKESAKEEIYCRKAREERQQGMTVCGQPWRVLVKNIVTSAAFEICSGITALIHVLLRCFIASNEQGEALANAADASSHAFMALLVIELMLRLLDARHTFPFERPRVAGWLWLRTDCYICGAYFLSLAAQPLEGMDEVYRCLRAMQVLRVLTLLRLLELLPPIRATHILLHGVAEGLITMCSALLFVGVLWMTLAILLASTAPADEEDGDLLTEYLGSVPSSLLTLFGTTTGGVRWGEEIVKPLLRSADTGQYLRGMMALFGILVSTFCIWNLVLGIYVRETMEKARHFDDQVLKYSQAAGQRNMQKLEEFLHAMDEDGTGYIAKDELEEALLSEDRLREFNIQKEDLVKLHDALDKQGSGEVLISELLFGILKLTGASKTVDMLSLSHGHQVVLRDTTVLGKMSDEQVSELSAALLEVTVVAKNLLGQISRLRERAERTEQDMMQALEREDAREAHKVWASRVFELLDTDGDGQLLQADFESQMFKDLLLSILQGITSDKAQAEQFVVFVMRLSSGSDAAITLEQFESRTWSLKTIDDDPALNDNLTKAEDMYAEAEEEAAQLERERAKMRRARRAIEHHIDSLQAELDDLLQAKVLGTLAAKRSAGEEIDITPLREEVARRLQSEVKPWLEQKLSGQGQVTL